jgi:hypothetical protein
MAIVDERAAEALYLAACPSFASPLKRFREEAEVEPLSFFNALHHLAEHLVSELEKGRTAEIVAVLAVVEDLFSRGNEAVIWATTLGLLITLQYEAKLRGLSPEVFVGDLGPKTWEWWNDLSKNYHGAQEW